MARSPQGNVTLVIPAYIICCREAHPPARLFHPFGFLHSRTPLISRAVAGQATHSGTPSIPHPGPPVQNPFAGCPGPLLNLTTPRFGQPLRRHSLDQDGISKSHSHTVAEYGGVDEARCNPRASFCQVCFMVVSRRARCNPLCPMQHVRTMTSARITHRS